MQLMADTGLTCGNIREDFTYVYHSGKSTIDLLVHNLHGDELQHLSVAEAVAGKHLPVQAVVSILALGRSEQEIPRKNIHPVT